MAEVATGPGGGFSGSYGSIPGYGGGAVGYGGGKRAFNGSQDYGGQFLPPMSVMQRPANFHSRSLGLLVLLPAVVFCLISVCYCFVFHQKPLVIWVTSGFFSCLAFLFMMARQREGVPRFWFNVGALVLLATVVANLLGHWNYRRHFFLYWAYEGQRDYADVNATDPAVRYLDAGRIYFSHGTSVNIAASGGVQLGGDQVCVAPIVKGDPVARSTAVQFWAAGINCCGTDIAREFTCDEVMNDQARSGLVFLDYGPRRDLIDTFTKAAEEASRIHGMKAAEDALFVSWVRDPLEAQQSYWRIGSSFLAGECVLYLAFSLLVGLALHFGGRRATKFSP